MPEFARFYAEGISDRLAAGRCVREPCWTEAVAVGSEEFIDATEQTVGYRRHMERYEVEIQPGEKAWAVRESTSPYTANSCAELPV